MKYTNTLFLVLALIFFSCQKQDLVADTTPSSVIHSEVLSEGVYTPDLAIVELERDMWSGRPVAGLQAKDPVLEVKTSYGSLYDFFIPQGEQYVRLTYDCLIANNRPQDKTGKNDALLLLTPENYNPETNSFFYDRFLVKTLYKDGSLLGIWDKEEFFVTTDEQRVGYDFSLQRYYGDDTSAIQAFGGDLYTNSVPVPSINNIPEDGLYVLTAEVNPYDYLSEWNNNKSNNLGRLPFKIQSGVASVDLSALNANKPNPVTNLSYTTNFKGRYKTVTLNWEGDAGMYCIVTLGKIVYEGYDKHYTDTVAANFKNQEYTVVAMNKGIGNTATKISVSK